MDGQISWSPLDGLFPMQQKVKANFSSGNDCWRSTVSQLESVQGREDHDWSQKQVSGQMWSQTFRTLTTHFTKLYRLWWQNTPSITSISWIKGMTALRRLWEERERSDCPKCYSLKRQTLQGLNHIKIQSILRWAFLSCLYVQQCRKTAHYLNPINFVSRCVSTKLISDQHIVQCLLRRQKEITASLAAVKLKHTHCCI